MDVTPCRSCGAPVIFLPYAVSGKLAILDAVPNVPKANLAIVDGKVFVDTHDIFDPLPAGDRFLSHWSSCPDRKVWRKATDEKKELFDEKGKS